MTVSRVGLRYAGRAAAVIASSRIQRTPVATFRSVSGLVVAVFVVSVFAGASSIVQSDEGPVARPGLLQPTSLQATVRSWVHRTAGGAAGLFGADRLGGHIKARHPERCYQIRPRCVV